ncbi:putative anthocyanidin reductase [Senna tora]|uniref:Putative anthocyanidin reductase n=1 Tax=Senna tora TaxID=362788 RepID=A0A834WXS1_9FABA|nr:putative anthocyanidin reductase [Senna tora]
MEEMMKEEGGGKRYCVSGGSGYIGSSLVGALLNAGHTVHATFRDPGKSVQLLSVWRNSDRLRLFQADLGEEGSFDDAVQGCDGVFHVAASMQFNLLPHQQNHNIEAHVEENIIKPAIEGVTNLLKSCLKSKSVKRVVFTSSISTITAKDSNDKYKGIVDESCQIQTQQVWKTKASGWVYALSKHLTEEAAFQFAKHNGIDLLSLITSTVAGPFFTASVPSSLQLLLSPITAQTEYFDILCAVNSRMGSIALVHIEDICRAHIFLMDNAKAQGRYICCTQTCSFSNFLNLLFRHYPSSNLMHRITEENHNKVGSEISSKKLKDLGFRYKHGLEDIIRQTILCCLDYGYLPPIIH